MNVSGVSTLGITTVTDLTGQQLNVSGVSTFQGSINLGDSHRLKFGDEGTCTFRFIIPVVVVLSSVILVEVILVSEMQEMIGIS